MKNADVSIRTLLYAKYTRYSHTLSSNVSGQAEEVVRRPIQLYVGYVHTNNVFGIICHCIEADSNDGRGADA